MNIPSISLNNYHNTYYSTRKNVTSPAFRGGRNEKITERVLNMLKDKVTSVECFSSLDDFAIFMHEWGNAKRALNPACKSVGMIFIPDKNLVEFLGKRASKFDTVNTQGVCLATGDVYGPIESWTKCYDAVAVLLPKLLKTCN